MISPLVTASPMERRARLLVPPMEGKHNLIRLIPIRISTAIFNFHWIFLILASCWSISIGTYWCLEFAGVGNLLVLGIYWCWDSLVLGFPFGVWDFGDGIWCGYWFLGPGEQGSNWKSLS